jgi:cell wall-associated NlpC family hydrolase
MTVKLRSRFAARVSIGARRIALAGTALLLAGGVATGIAQVAGARPAPTIAETQAKINALTAKFDKVNEQYDKVAQQLSSAKAQLRRLNKQLAHDQSVYEAARKKVVQIAASAYEDSGQTSLAGLLTSNDPATILSQASIVMQITGARNLQTQNFLAQAKQLSAVQQSAQNTELGIQQLANQKAHQKDQLNKLLQQQKDILASLTATQVTQVQGGTVNGGGGVTHGHYTGPTKTQAEKAVAFVFNQLGCQYVYGATGPCSAGFDCSGLVMQAWAAGGVTIPRVTYDQWAALPHVAVSDLQPGDLLYYNGYGHVAMYVGGGMFIDAPAPGQVVRELPMNTAWYSSTFDGAARP